MSAFRHWPPFSSHRSTPARNTAGRFAFRPLQDLCYRITSPAALPSHSDCASTRAQKSPKYPQAPPKPRILEARSSISLNTGTRRTVLIPYIVWPSVLTHGLVSVRLPNIPAVGNCSCVVSAQRSVLVSTAAVKSGTSELSSHTWGWIA